MGCLSNAGVTFAQNYFYCTILILVKTPKNNILHQFLFVSLVEIAL